MFLQNILFKNSNFKALYHISTGFEYLQRKLYVPLKMNKYFSAVNLILKGGET